MSKSSTATAPKNPTPPPAKKSAWSRGPPQTATATGPKTTTPPPAKKSAWSKAPSQTASAPTPPSYSPAQTHSRRRSALSQGVPIKDGVSIPRGNVGVAEGSVVTFRSIDDASAPISSSPAAASAIKSEGVKSFGTVLAAPGHVNERASISFRSSIAATSSSYTPATSSTYSAPSKPAKMDILKMFENPSSAPSSHPPSDTSSPSMRSADLPPQQPPQQGQSSPTQQPQLGSPPYTAFFPRSQQNSGPGRGPPRSPVYSRQTLNGSGLRSQGGPNSGTPAGLSSPRLGHHSHNVQPSGMPPSPPQMQPQMQPRMPSMPGWPAYHPSDQHQMPQYNWYNASANVLTNTSSTPQHHPPPGPHIPEQGTPTLSHAVPNTPQPPLLSHPQPSMGSVSSPPPTPLTASLPTTRLNVKSNAFVPTGRAKITIRTPDGQKVKLEDLVKRNTTPSSASSALPPQSSVYQQGSPGTPTRRPASTRMETKRQRRKRLAEEEEKKREKTHAEAEAEEKVRLEKEEEERKRKEEEEKEQLRKGEEEKERLRKEDGQRLKEGEDQGR